MNRQEQRIKELVLGRVAKCGQCGGLYELPDVNVLGHKDDLWFLMLICGQCHQAVGVAAVVREEVAKASREPYSIARRQPERAAESRPQSPIADRGPVTREDVSTVKEFLKGFDGDFKRLFGERA